MPEIITYSKKICMMGTFGVGKTSLVRQFVHGLFDDSYLTTVGVQIFQKEVATTKGNEAVNIKLLLWDLANIEEMTPAIRNYFTGAAGAVIVTDLTRPDTCNASQIHIPEFRQANPSAKLIIVGNKQDLVKPSPAPVPLGNLAETYHSSVILTSAKTGENVEALFQTMAEQITQDL